MLNYLRPTTETTVETIVPDNAAVSTFNYYQDANVNGTSALDSAPIEDSPEPNRTIEELFNEYGFTVDFRNSREYCLVVDEITKLASYIARNHSLIQDFLGYLRLRLGKDLSISYSMERLTEDERNATVKFVTEWLTPYGMLSMPYINYTTGIITATIPAAHRIHSFLTGGWLEIYARWCVEYFISKKAEELGLDYEVYSNLLVTKGGKPHELDVVFKLENGYMCWIECKTGKFKDFATFYETVCDLASVPADILLTGSNMTDDATSAIGYFYRVNCCNLDSLLTKVREMIDDSIDEDDINN